MPCVSAPAPTSWWPWTAPLPRPTPRRPRRRRLWAPHQPRRRAQQTAQPPPAAPPPPRPHPCRQWTPHWRAGPATRPTAFSLAPSHRRRPRPGPSGRRRGRARRGAPPPARPPPVPRRPLPLDPAGGGSRPTPPQAPDVTRRVEVAHPPTARRRCRANARAETGRLGPRPTPDHPPPLSPPPRPHLWAGALGARRHHRLMTLTRPSWFGRGRWQGAGKTAPSPADGATPATATTYCQHPTTSDRWCMHAAVPSTPPEPPRTAALVPPLATGRHPRATPRRTQVRQQ